MLIGHNKQWEFLKKKFEQNQLSHSYLFVGKDGIGKKLFAEEFLKLIGCKFPDFMIVGEQNKKDEVFGDGGEIKISQIREVQNFLSYKSYNGGFKAVIVNEAEKMNQEAQNSFLKTLEEPKGQTLLFLITSKPDMLLPTISSRCQTVKFFKPKGLPENKEKTEREKKIFQEMSEVLNSNLADKFKYVKSIDFQEQDASEIIKVLQKYLRHSLMAKIGAEKADAKDIVFEKMPVPKLQKAVALADEILNKLLFTNANPKLALEILLMEL